MTPVPARARRVRTPRRHRHAVERHRARGHDRRVLASSFERDGRPSLPQREVDPDVVRVPPGRRRRTGELAHEDGCLCVAQAHPGKRGQVLERGWAVAGGRGLVHPQLDRVEPPPEAGRRLLGVRDPATRPHEVQLPGTDHLFRAEAVPVHELTLDQPRHGLQPHMGMGADLGRGILRPDGTDVVGEAPRAHGPTPSDRQCAAHRERSHLRCSAVASAVAHPHRGARGPGHVPTVRRRVDRSGRPGRVV